MLLWTSLQRFCRNSYVGRIKTFFKMYRWLYSRTHQLLSHCSPTQRPPLSGRQPVADNRSPNSTWIQGCAGTIINPSVQTHLLLPGAPLHQTLSSQFPEPTSPILNSSLDLGFLLFPPPLSGCLPGILTRLLALTVIGFLWGHRVSWGSEEQRLFILYAPRDLGQERGRED